MSPRMRVTVFAVCYLPVVLLAGVRFAAAQDYNIDYSGVPGTCSTEYGGAVLEINSVGTITVSRYLVIQNNAELYYRGGIEECTPHTWFTFACDGNCPSSSSPPSSSVSIKAGQVLHLGVTVNKPSTVTTGGYVYSNNASLSPWQATDNNPNCTASCSVVPKDNKATAAAEGYTCLSGTGWWVHNNGKTLTVINGTGRCPCPGTLYVGKIRFEYYGVRQALSDLNRYSEREPFRVDTLPGATAACSETLNFSRDAPPDAKFVVVNAKADVVPTLDSPAAVEVWLQEIIVGPGEHLIVVAAEPHGTLDPRGPVAVADHGSQTFNIIPDAGYVIADVLVDGVSVGRPTSYTFSDVTRDHDLHVRFGPPNTAPDCGDVAIEPATLWPPDHKLVPIHITGITDADGDPVAVTIKSITQDEPLGQGCGGATDVGCPDAVVTADGDIQLRAERDGKGNGRVYTIAYTASDGRGGTCDGSVRVCVPHDRGHAGCQDDGQTVNSLGSSGRMTRGANHEADERAAGFGLRIESTDVHVATVHYSLPAAGPVHLAVFDLAGRRVVTLVDDVQEEGDHVSVWNAAGLARGMYFCRLQVGSTVVTRSRLILR